MNASRRAVLTLYVRSACSLCEEARILLEAQAADAGVVLDLVDVDTDPRLEEEYGERVPVGVAADGRELFELAIEPARVRDVLEQAARTRIGNAQE